MKWLRIGGIVVAVCVALVIIMLGGMLAFGKAKPPAVAVEFGDQFRRVDYRDLPPLESYRARDGTELSYRSYRGGATDAQSQKVAVLIHGATDSSAGMHVVAKSLAQAGLTSYEPDVLGDGAHQPPPGISQPDQLGDDSS